MLTLYLLVEFPHAVQLVDLIWMCRATLSYAVNLAECIFQFRAIFLNVHVFHYHTMRFLLLTRAGAHEPPRQVRAPNQRSVYSVEFQCSKVLLIFAHQIALVNKFEVTIMIINSCLLQHQLLAGSSRELELNNRRDRTIYGSSRRSYAPLLGTYTECQSTRVAILSTLACSLTSSAFLTPTSRQDMDKYYQTQQLHFAFGSFDQDA